MEKQYSVQFFTSFVENLQDVCRKYLQFSQFVEVSGYVSVEIDNMKKERYVLSELLQISGNVVSESYCTKAFKTSQPIKSRETLPGGERSRPWMGRSNTGTQGGRENVLPQNQNRRRSWAASTGQEYQGPHKARRSSEVIEIIDDPQVARTNRTPNQTSGQFQSAVPHGQQGQRWPVSTTTQRGPRPPNLGSRLPATSHKQPRHGNVMPRAGYNQTMIPEQERPQQMPVNQVSRQPPFELGPRRVNALKDPSPQLATSQQGNIEQFNVKRPPQAPAYSPAPVVKTEFAGDSTKNTSSDTNQSSVKQNLEQSVPVTPSFTSRTNYLAELTSNNSSSDATGVDKLIKTEPMNPETPVTSVFDEDEIIDLDLFDDDLDDGPPGSKDDQMALAKDYGVSGQNTSRREAGTNPGTQKVVMYAVKLFKSYLFKKNGVEVDFFSVAPEQLDKMLLDFYNGARKMNGDELNARTLKNVQIHLDMYFREQGYAYSIAKDEVFHSSREFVKKRLDNYVSTTKHLAIDDNDIEILFQRGILGCHTPEVLFHTMWFINAKYFGIRRPMEHFNLKWGEICLQSNEMGQEYLERKINNAFSLKVFAKNNNPSRCFVNIYKRFCTLRPNETLSELSPFYLSYGRSPNFPNPNFWFSNEGVGWSRFQNMWRRLVIAGGLDPAKKL